MNTKLTVFAVALVVCLSSVAIVAGTDDSDAADDSVTYNIYLQLNDGENIVEKWLDPQLEQGINADSYRAAVIAACKEAGYTAEFGVDKSKNMLQSITADGVKYVSGDWNTQPYYGYAIYYADGDDWKTTNNFTEGSTIAIVFDKYIHAGLELDDYYDSGFGYYQPCVKDSVKAADPDSNNLTYNFYLQLNDGKETPVEKWLDPQTETEVSSASFNAAIKAAFDAAGYTIDITEKNWLKSITANDVVYAPGVWEKEPYFGFSLYYLNGDDWKAVSTYDEGSTIAIVFDQYVWLPADHNIDSYDGTNAQWGYYTYEPKVKTNSYPVPNSVTYKIYLQLNDGTNSVSKWLEPQKESIVNGESFADALKAGCEAAGYTVDVSGSWLKSITADGVTYAPGNWGSGSVPSEQPYYGFATYYADGDDWKMVSSYEESSTIAIVFDKYLFAGLDLDDEYVDSTFGYYMPGLKEGVKAADPDSNNLTYNFYLQLNDGKNTVGEWLEPQTVTEVSSASFNAAIKAAFDAPGFGIDIKDSNWLTSVTAYDVVYSTGTWQKEPYFGFALYYLDGDDWKAVSNYAEGSTIAIVFDQYVWLPADHNIDDYEDSTYGYYTYEPTVSTASANGGDNDDDDNTLVYAAVAIVIVVVIVAAVGFFMYKKKSA